MFRDRDSGVGWFIVAGLVAMPIGLVLLVVGLLGGTFRMAYTRGQDAGIALLLPFALFLMGAGFLMTIGGLLYGYSRGKREYRGTGERTFVRDVKVVTRYVYNRFGEMANDEFLWQEGDDNRFYVKLAHPNGLVREYEASQEVYRCCGEGMTGDAEVDGKWLGAFRPTIGAGDVQPYG